MYSEEDRFRLSPASPDASEHRTGELNSSADTDDDFYDKPLVNNSTESEELAAQLANELANCEEAELLLEQDEAKRKVNDPTKVTNAGTDLENQPNFPIDTLVSEPVRNCAPSPPFSAVSNDFNVRPKQLRRPKQETVDRYNLLGCNENLPPTVNEIRPICVRDTSRNPAYNQGRGYWLKPNEIDWAQIRVNQPALSERAQARQAGSWESIYDTFYRHLLPENSRESIQPIAPQSDYRLPAQYPSEESDLTSDYSRSSVSASNRRFGPYYNRPSHYEPNIYPEQLSNSSGQRDPNTSHRHSHEHANRGPHAEIERHPARRHAYRQRRPLAELSTNGANYPRPRRVLQLPEETRPRPSQHSDRRQHNTRSRDCHRESTPNFSRTNSRNVSPERVFENKLNEVSNQVESLRREICHHGGEPEPTQGVTRNGE